MMEWCAGPWREVYAWGLNSYGQLGVAFDFGMKSSDQIKYFPYRAGDLCGRAM